MVEVAQLSFSCTFWDLLIAAFDDANFTSSFRSAYIASIAAYAKLDASYVSIAALAAGSVAVSTAVQQPGTSNDLLLPLMASLKSGAVPTGLFSNTTIAAYNATVSGVAMGTASRVVVTASSSAPVTIDTAVIGGAVGGGGGGALLLLLLALWLWRRHARAVAAEQAFETWKCDAHKTGRHDVFLSYRVW